jgi:hypothetical protein
MVAGMVGISSKIFLFDSTGSTSTAYIHVLDTRLSFIFSPSRLDPEFTTLFLISTRQRNLMTPAFRKPEDRTIYGMLRSRQRLHDN